MPLVEVNLIAGRDSDTRRLLISRITDVIRDTLQVPQETIRVLIRELPAENWGVAGLPKSGSGTGRKK